ncbi:reprolysin-like metallopeptidase [Flavobacterium sp.]|uniref:zinc-dependent metalloprotease n=1 Tax=Flavobacterium sp. TaxID=239 RepID=UPI0025C2619F|nr:zinc-dependent metalloprotease family protein [Flavobacterium sp.]
MKKSLLFLALAATIGQVSAQKGESWTKVAASKAAGLERVRQAAASEEQNLYQVNVGLLKQKLAATANRNSGNAGVVLQFPNRNGAIESFSVWENSNFEPELQAQYPDIRAYVGKGITDPTATIHFSLSPLGVQTMVRRADKTEFIEPLTKDASVYVIFESSDNRPGRLPLVCKTDDVALTEELGRNSNVALSNNGVYKTMRLAMSTNGEYTTFYGGTVAGALAGINATMTRVNGVFETDLALHLNLVAGSSAVIYTNAATDPYTAYNTGNGIDDWNAQLQTALTANVGEANYDIGHLFGANGGGGNAGCIGCVCNDGTKGRGITSPADGIPQGDFFDIDYVAHEMGHQLGANHTFSHSAENNAVNVEPGSGSTIMGYAGITGATDVQAHSDDYFTYRSILQIQTNLNLKTCPVSVPVTTPAPTVNAGLDYTIPKGTAFKLTGTGSGTGNLTYAWEQNDDATTVNATASFPAGTKIQGPNFRSLPPTGTPVRYMPNFATVLSGTTSNTWEAVSTVARTLNFTLTAWNNINAGGGGGQTQTDAMVVTVNGTAGPFTVTAPALNTSWLPGSGQTVTWNVAGTTANNVNTANVNILFSSDGGVTWTTLAANTPNDGTQAILLPAVYSANCRILVEAAGNIFYAVSPRFAVGYTVATTCNTYSNTTALPIPDGAAANTFGPTATSTINIADGGTTISDVNVVVAATHTYMWDVEAKLVHPNNTTSSILLFRQCNQASGAYNVTLNDGSPNIVCGAGGSAVTGTYAPYQPLNVFNGLPVNGTYKLEVRDSWSGDTGTLNSWQIQVCTEVATLGTQQFGLTDFALYPNPNAGNFTVQFAPKGSGDVNVAVHDIRGRQVYDRKYGNSGFFAQNIQLNNVQAGVYVVTVQEGDQKEVRKIVIQ